MQTPHHNDVLARVEAVRTVIQEAGALALSWFGRLSTLKVETKASGQDAVSLADREVEQFLRARLSSTLPQDGFLGEEYGLSEGSSGFTWVIDPIDGTSCFIHGIRNWCIAIALVRDNRTLAGLVFDPNADEMFSAVVGEGATLNGQPISVDLATDLQHGFTSVGASGRVTPDQIAVFIRQLLEAGGMFVRSGSGALSLAHVACGRLAAYYEPHMNAWDCLAAQCIIREAGGWANDVLVEGSLLGGAPVVGCAPQIREQLLTLIETSNTEATA